jgi:uncharacterized protein
VFSNLEACGVVSGLVAGIASGFLGVSPGGILVPVISMLLPYSQHVVQGMSLLAQAPPTSMAAVSQYSRRNVRERFSSAAVICLGFVAGGPAGAWLARLCSERTLRWMFVGYLLVLMILSSRKKKVSGEGNAGSPQGTGRLSFPVFLVFIVIGIAAGASSGLLGIGGGLAIVALSVGLLHVERREAQILSLTVSAFPLTLPAAFVYMRQGFSVPRDVVVALIAGLALGSWLGGLCANRLPERGLQLGFMGLLGAMALYMTLVAIRT